MNHDYYKNPCKKSKNFNDAKYLSNNDPNGIPIHNLTDITLNSFEDLVWLSYKSPGKLGNLLTFEDKDILLNFINTKVIQPILDNCSSNYLKLYLTYKTLSEEQKKVFLDIHNTIASSSNSILCIDAGPGTGKTFIIASLAITCKINPCYMVYTRKLERELAKLCTIHSFTNCKFLMDSLDISFCKQKALWNSKKNGHYMTICEKIHDILALTNRIQLPASSDLYILDEYSVVSPMFIFFLYCLSIKWNLHILFVGDRFQQSSINKSIFHCLGNFVLIQTLTTKQYLLDKRIRQNDDISFQEKLKLVTNNLLLKNYCGTDISMNFALKYALYEIFKPHFSLPESFSTIYLAQYHKDIKKRLLRYVNKLKHGTFRLAYVCTKTKNRDKGNDNFVELRKDGVEKDTRGKFLPYLVLVKGQYYNYIANSAQQMVVEYLGLYKEDSKIVVVRDISNQYGIFLVKPRSISPEFMHTEQIKWLKTYYTNSTIYQYPLLARTFTYHAAQGITIQEDIVELNIDTATLNSFYVGLTRLKKLSQLGKIHTKDFLNLVVTDFFNDAYYYKLSYYTKIQIENRFCCQNDTVEEEVKRRIKDLCDFIKILKFKETRNLSIFNRSHNDLTNNYKISRIFFNNTQDEDQQTNSKLLPLLQIIKSSSTEMQLAMFEYSQEHLREYLKEF